MTVFLKSYLYYLYHTLMEENTIKLFVFSIHLISKVHWHKNSWCPFWRFWFVIYNVKQSDVLVSFDSFVPQLQTIVIFISQGWPYLWDILYDKNKTNDEHHEVKFLFYFNARHDCILGRNRFYISGLVHILDLERNIWEYISKSPGFILP